MYEIPESTQSNLQDVWIRSHKNTNWSTGYKMSSLCPSLHSPFDHSFLCVHGSGLGLGGPDLRALHLDVPSQSRLRHNHPPPSSALTHIFTQATGLQPQQQLRPPQQQQFGQRCLQLPPTGLLPRALRPGRAQTLLQGLHLPPSPPLQSNRKGGWGRKPNHCASHADRNHINGISSNSPTHDRHTTQTCVILGEQGLEGNPCCRDPTASLWKLY